MSVGKRIYLKRKMPDPEIVEQFKSIPASNTADVMGRSCAMNPRIHLVSSPKAQMMAGPAFTVKCRAGDNLALHAALNFCHEGDVLVVSNEEDNTRSLMGEVNVPISCGGISVNPGDIILADPDGIIVIPRNDAPHILEEAKKFQAADEAKLEKTRQGIINRSWVDKTLEEKGFEIVDDVYQN